MSVAQRRTMRVLDATVAIVAALVIAIVVDYLAARPDLRVRIDATKTRAYALSPQTEELLGSLTDDWEIAVVVVESEVSPAARRQLDEVLRRFERSSEYVKVTRIDPTDPAAVPRYDALIASLREREGEDLARWDAALDDGEAAFRDLQQFALTESAAVETVLAATGDALPGAAQTRTRVALLGLLAREGQQVLDAVAAARRAGDGRPVPDYDEARSTLAEALRQWARELDELSAALEQWTTSSVPAAVRTVGARVAAPASRLAERLAATGDDLVRLRPLAIASIGRRLQGGEAAVVIGPDSAAVIPPEQLLPRLPAGADTVVAFDQRFRGEQVIASAMRSLIDGDPPTVVFVHAEGRSLRDPLEGRIDLAGMNGLLETARIEVAEWIVGAGPRPTLSPDRDVAWVVVPPLRRTGVDPTPAEQRLLESVSDLLAEGEAVMINLLPSLLPQFRRPDPWAALVAPLGVVADTGQVIFEAQSDARGDDQYVPNLTLDQFTGSHPVSRALDGQRALFTLPVPLGRGEGEGAIARTVIAEVEPDARRWLEPQWATRALDSEGGAERGAPFTDAQPIALALERDGRQRVLVVGSGTWMLSNVADAVTAVGGSRSVLLYPGNAELMLAGVTWLAGRDDAIAASPVSGQAARLTGIDGAVTAWWAVVSTLILPGICLGIALGVWMVRR